MRKFVSVWARSVACLLLLVSAAAAEATTIRVNYDVGYGNRITLRGSKAPLSWTAGVNATWTTGNVWTYTWPDTAGDVELKPLINDATWSVGANYSLAPGLALVAEYTQGWKRERGTDLGQGLSNKTEANVLLIGTRIAF